MQRYIPLALVAATLSLVIAVAIAIPVAEAQGTVPATDGFRAYNGDFAGELTVTWFEVPEAAHYRIGYVNMDTDLPAAMAAGDWTQAFRYVDVANSGRTSHTLRNLERGAMYAVTVGTMGAGSEVVSWPTRPVWRFVWVTPDPGMLPNPAYAPGPLSASELERLVKPALARVSYRTTIIDSQTGEEVPATQFGTAFVIRSDGLMIGNRHVVEDETTVKVEMQTLDGELVETTGAVLGTGIISDLAVIKVDSDQTFAFLELGNSDAVAVGDEVTAWGHPAGDYFGDDPTVTRGIISGKRIFEDADWLQTDSAINPGNSGGPLIDEYGRVIGVNTAKIVGVAYEALGLAIASNEVRARVSELESGGPDSAVYQNLWKGYDYRVTIPRGWYLAGEYYRGCTTFAPYHEAANASICAEDLDEIEDELPENRELLIAFAEFRAREAREVAEEIGFIFEEVAFERVEMNGTDFYRLEYNLRLPPEIQHLACVDHRVMLIGLSSDYPENPHGFSLRVGVCEEGRERYDAERDGILNSFRP